MIFRINDNEFDFSIAIHQAENGVFYTHDETPRIFDNEIICILHKALENFVDKEYRFIGILDNEDMVIFRCYVRNGNIWENVIFDELTEILKTVEHLDNIHKIVNCLMYEKV